MLQSELRVFGVLASKDVSELFMLLAICIILLVFVTSIHDAYLGPLSIYPGPKFRAISHLPKIISDMSGRECIDLVKLHDTYGPIVRIAPNQLSYSGGAQAFKDIYALRKPGLLNHEKDDIFHSKPLSVADGLSTRNDELHARQRKQLSYAFADRSIKILEPMLKSLVSKMKDKLLDHATNQEPTNMLKYYNCLAFDIMGTLCFDEDLDMLEDGKYTPWIAAMFSGIKQDKQIQSLGRFNKLARYIVDEWAFRSKAICEKQWEHFSYSKDRVNRRLARTPEQPDLWTKILDNGKDSGKLSLEEHYANAALFMLAGTETLATALSGITYWLLRNPSCVAKLTAEVREAFPDFDSMTLDSAARLKYLDAVIREGLRLYPPFPTAPPRIVCKGGAIICGSFVPEGTSIGVHHLSTYHSREHFKDPLEFRPERWLGDQAYKNDHLDGVEPFGVGPRNCLGKSLAYHELRLILAATFLHFDLKLCEESAAWSDQKVYILWEKMPLMCTLAEVQAS